jgi:hypothetical protein
LANDDRRGQPEGRRGFFTAGSEQGHGPSEAVAGSK